VGRLGEKLWRKYKKVNGVAILMMIMFGFVPILKVEAL